ncbi:MAG: hypothetical protein OXU20_09085 [Myxococcales bacterium]|nr:hypothetical protein [Myxococcales bacterium]
MTNRVRTLAPCLRAAATLVLIASIGCADSDEPTPGERLDFGDGASEGVDVAILVSALEGGQLELSTGAAMSIPAGALDEDLKIGMRRPPDEEAIKLVASIPNMQIVASAPYVLTPHGTQFTSPVELRLPARKGVDLERTMVVYLEDEHDTEWKTLESFPTFEGNMAIVWLSHFSVLALVEREQGFDAGARPIGSDGAVTIGNPFADPPTGGLDAATRASERDASEDDPTADAGARDMGSVMPNDAGKTQMNGGGGDAGARDAGVDGGTTVDGGAEVDAGPADAGASDASVDSGVDGGVVVDSGTVADGGPVRDAGASLCGNGVLDEFEACDTSIAFGMPGACPTIEDCTAMSDGCEYTSSLAGGGCDLYCAFTNTCAGPTCGNGIVELPESCDTNVAAGNHGACPTAADCDALDDQCYDYYLVSQGPCFEYCDYNVTCF